MEMDARARKRMRISDVAQQGFRVQFYWRGGVDKLECDEDKAETVFLCFRFYLTSCI